MAGLYNINLEQNGTYQETFTWKDGSNNPVDLTDYTPEMQIRDKDGNILLDVGQGGYITISNTPTNGQFTIDIPASIIAAATWKTGRYDVFMVDTHVSPTYKKKLLKGDVSIDSSETQ